MKTTYKPYKMKKIKLTKEQYAIVDNEDFEYLNQFRWSYLDRGKYTGYAIRSGRGKTVYMHREIMGTKDGELTDHIDGDGLNNRRSNLRIASPAQNQANRRPRKIGSSGVVGVYLSKGKKKSWQARYSRDDKWLHIGYFLTKEEAGEAYNKVITKVRGDFAPLSSENK